MRLRGRRPRSPTDRGRRALRSRASRGEPAGTRAMRGKEQGRGAPLVLKHYFFTAALTAESGSRDPPRGAGVRRMRLR